MSFTLVQSRRFIRRYKGLHENQLNEVHAAIITIFESPHIGQIKKGDLTGVRIFKFACRDQIFLLAYTVNESLHWISLEGIGTHENFYRNLKRK